MSVFYRWLGSFLLAIVFARSFLAKGIGANDYDQKNIFDPSGHQRQLEFADKAILHHSGNLCCIQLNDGILFVSSLNRPLSRFIKGKAPRVMTFDNNKILAAASGLSHDSIGIFNTFKTLLQRHREIFPTWLKYDSSPLIEELSEAYSKHLYQKHDLYSEQIVRDDDFEQYLQRVPGVNLLLAGMASGKSELAEETKTRGRIVFIRPDGSRSQHKAITQGKSADAIIKDLTTLFCLDKNDTVEVDIDEAIRRIVASGFLKRYFCSFNDIPMIAFDEVPLENQKAEGNEYIDNHLEMYVMYTKQKKSTRRKPVLGVWHKLNIHSILK